MSRTLPINVPDISERPWGKFETLLRITFPDGNNSVVKKIVIKPNQRTSDQKHSLRCEHWTFVFGQGHVVLNGDVVPVRPGIMLKVPAGHSHMVINSDEVDPLIYIEVTTGFFDEDDIRRLSDEYGRT